MSEHAWFTENLAGYAADGLPADERARLERHAGECPECAQALASQREFDASMAKLFASARPKPGFENRVLAALRTAPLRRRVQWLKTMRWIGSAAAVILLGVIGFAMHEFAQTGTLPFVWSRFEIFYTDLEKGAIVAGPTLSSSKTSGFGGGGFGGGGFGGGGFGGGATMPGFPAPSFWKDDETVKYRFRVLAGSKDSGGSPNKQDPAADQLDKSQEEVTKSKVPILTSEPDGAFSPDGKKALSAGGKLKGKDVSAGEEGPPVDGESNTVTVRVKEAQEGFDDTAKRLDGLQQLHTARVPKVNQEHAGALTWSAPRPPAEVVKAADNKAGDKLTALREQVGGEGRPLTPPGTTGPMVGGGPGFGAGAPGRVGAGGYGGFAYTVDSSKNDAKDKRDPDGRPGGPVMTIAPSIAPPPSPGQPPPVNAALPGLMGPGSGEAKKTTVEYYEALPSGASKPGDGDPKAGEGGASSAKGPGGDRREGKDGKGDGYFRSKEEAEGDKQFAQGPGNSQESGQNKAAGKQPKGEDKTPDDDKSKQPPAKTQPAAQPKTTAEPKAAAEPKATARKIIRTGEVEFEIQAFDDAVASVTRLITGIPGAFVATVNSEKLPNGKVRGSIVVRTPPETLDQFLLDMRKELGKTGELKSQRIGSQDVTKAYYDLESRLRAARTMEDRLINIIKSGKGEIKDLLLAEKELGVWRTKIEEMEGEIRYYNNQVSMSTLTITLFEKEIRSAAAMVITERVNMKIECEDVEQSLQSALMAVTEAKGRVTRSDSKLHAAGQYEAHLQFEVAPSAAPAVKEKLKKLGIVTHHDAQRQQQAEGGTGAAGVDIKSRTSDVQFSVELFNVANIQPREAYVLQIISEDVPADYRKLQEAVTQASGQVRMGNLNEQDKLNISAQFDFDVPATARNVIDKMVTGLGDVLTRSTTRAPAGERSTDRKVGFRLTLLNLANIKPRESYVLKVATQDVPAEYRRLQDAIVAAKGQLRTISLNEQDKLNTAAQIDFDVPKAARDSIDKMLAAMGDVLERNTVRAGPTETSTDRKTGYRLTLLNLANIPARESYVVHVATTEVSGDYRKVQEVIAEAKGQIRAINLNEQDKLNTTAQIDFDVPAEDRAKIDGLMKELGEITVRNTVRVPQGQTATNRKVGYQLILRNIASVRPRESYTIQAVSLDVPGGYKKLQDAVAQAKGYVHVGQLNEHDKLNISAQFDFDLPSAERDVIEKLLVEVGDAYSRNTQRVAPNEVATDRKVGYRLTIKSVAGMPPREKVTLDVEVKDVEQAAGTFKDMVRAKSGTVVADPINHGANGRVNAMLLFNVPLSAKDELVRKFKAFGTVRESKSSTNPQAADTKLATVHIDVMLSNATPIVPSDQGLWPQIRRSLSMSFQFLSWSLTFIILGLSVVLPWALLLWVAVKLIKRMRGKAQPAAATGA